MLECCSVGCGMCGDRVRTVSPSWSKGIWSAGRFPILWDVVGNVWGKPIQGGSPVGADIKALAVEFWFKSSSPGGFFGELSLIPQATTVPRTFWCVL